MIRRTPRSTSTDTRFPYTTLFRSGKAGIEEQVMPHFLLNADADPRIGPRQRPGANSRDIAAESIQGNCRARPDRIGHRRCERSEEHTSDLQSLMRISYAVFCLKKKKKLQPNTTANKSRNHTQ